MFSVVIPTMWRGQEFKIMLPLLTHDTFVAEIIVVNNDSANTPTWFQPHKKIRVIDHGKNIFVNPAWNQGVAEAKTDKLCILSDDVAFHPTLVSQLRKDVTSKVGVMGPHVKNFRSKEQPLTAKPHSYLETERPFPRQPSFGCLMFVHRESWVPIPEELLIYYGDTFLTSYNFCVLQRLNHYYTNQDMRTTWGTTSKNEEFKEQAFKEHLAREEVFNKYIPQQIWKPVNRDQLVKDMNMDAEILDRLTHK